MQEKMTHPPRALFDAHQFAVLWINCGVETADICFQQFCKNRHLTAAECLMLRGLVATEKTRLTSSKGDTRV